MTRRPRACPARAARDARAARVVVVLMVAALFTLLVPQVAQAHGGALSPGTRTYFCYTDGHWTGGDLDPRNAACKAAVAQGGKQPLWDWFGVLRSDGAGRTRGYIPDGKLCSGANPKYAAYDLARADWPVTHLTAGASWTVRYNAWAAHPGVFTLFVTKDGYDPRKPLTWDSLEAKPFSTWSETRPNGPGEYRWKATLPSGKSGRHVIYSIWSRTDSKETFYNCSDVVFDGGTGQVTGYPGAGGATAADDLTVIEPPQPGAATPAAVPPTAAPASIPAAAPLPSKTSARRPSRSPSRSPSPKASSTKASRPTSSVPRASGQKPVSPSGTGQGRAVVPSAPTGQGAAAVPNAALGGTPDSCTATVTQQQLRGGALVQVFVVNHGAPVDPWTVTVETPAPVTLVAGWSGRVQARGTTVTASAPSWHSGLGDAEPAQVSYLMVGRSVSPSADDVRLNGLRCNSSRGSRGGSGTSDGDAAAPPPSAALPVAAPPSAAPPSAALPVAAPPPAAPPVAARAVAVRAVASPSVAARAAPARVAGCAAGVRCDGFESQSGTTPSGLWRPTYPDCRGAGTIHVDTAVRHTGSTSLRVNGAAGYCNHAFVSLDTSLASLGRTVYARVWVRHASPLPVGHVTFLAFADAADGGKDLRVGGQNRALQWNRSSDDATLPEQSPAGVARSAALPTGSWHCLELAVLGASGGARTWLDGVPVTGLTADTARTPDVDRHWDTRVWRPSLTALKLGWESYADGADTVWFDDVAVAAQRIGCR